MRLRRLMATIVLVGLMPLTGQTLRSQPPAETEPSTEKLQEQIQNLKSPSYRTRQLALWYLEQNPKRALPLLRAAGKTTDLNIGSEVVGLLSTQAMIADTDISVEAHEALREIAGGKQSVTAVSQLAIDALEGIAVRQEFLAQQALVDLNVDIGPLPLNINGGIQNIMGSRNSIILHVKDNFTGTAQHLRLFRFLRSVDTAYLEGHSVTTSMLREVLAMPGIRRLVLKGSAINNDMLQTIFDVRELDHLELQYTPVDDQAVDTIVDLPLVGSLRLFGTKISREGAERLKKDLDLDVYIARGGFLGVQTAPTDTRVSEVVRGSGAEKGGIIRGDIITHINGKPIKIFEQLRNELAHFAPGESVDIVVERRGDEAGTIKLSVVLGVQETQPN